MNPKFFIISCSIFVLVNASMSLVTPVHAQEIVMLNSADEEAEKVPGIHRDGEYRVGPADVLQISVWKNEALSRTVPVRPDGMISFPLVNEIKAAGMTPMQLRDIIKKRLMEYMPKPEVSVIVMEMHSFIVSVLGEVKKPGRYQFTSQVTVLDVLAQSGGITEFASTSNLYVLRTQGSTRTKIPFNYSKVITSPVENDNFFIQPGDIIVVP